jgi:hypothetical protein
MLGNKDRTNALMARVLQQYQLNLPSAPSPPRTGMPSSGPVGRAPPSRLYEPPVPDADARSAPGLGGGYPQGLASLRGGWSQNLGQVMPAQPQPAAPAPPEQGTMVQLPDMRRPGQPMPMRPMGQAPSGTKGLGARLFRRPQ